MKQVRQLLLLLLLLAGAGRWSLCFGQVLIVTTVDDADDGACDATHCSLREAITAANRRAGADRIIFGLPGSGPFLLALRLPLPELTDAATVIDGSTQAGAGPEGIILDGSALPVDAHGLVLRAADCAVFGLQIRGVPDVAILVSDARGARIGADLPRQGNILVANGVGIRVDAGSTGAVIESNFIGLLPDGTADGNRTGIVLDGLVREVRDIRIGGPTPAAGNMISGNGGPGIFARQAAGLLLLSNRIGVDRAGLETVPNQGSGIDFNDCQEITIGQAPFSGNVISGNGEHGILLRRFRESRPLDAVIEANRIGCDRSGEAALSNRQSGIFLDQVAGVRIGAEGAGNLISGNRAYGIAGNRSADISIVGNTIGANGSATLTLGNGLDGIALDNGRNVSVAGNLLAGNRGGGLALTACSASVIQGNFIGVSRRGLALGNERAGIRLTDCRDIQVGTPVAGEGNVVAYHPEGLLLDGGSAACTVRGNSLYCNGRGLELRAGANAGMPPPLNLCGTLTEVSGRATPGATVDVYGHDPDSCPDSPCQGRTYLGSAAAGADSSWIFSVALSPAALITATATDGQGNTSSFAVCTPVRERPLARADNGGAVCPGAPFTLLGAGEGAGDLRYEWRGPDGYRSSQRDPGDALAAGWYYLFVRQEGCVSAPDSTEALHLGPVEVVIGDDPSEWICPGDSVVVNGRVYNQANPRGVERILGAGPACDTLVRIDLNIRDAIPGRLEETLCPGESLVVGDNTFDEQRPAGSVLLPGAAASGCDSLVEVRLQFVAIEANVAAQGVRCPGAADGSVVLFDVRGGRPPYRLMFNGAASEVIGALPRRFGGLGPGVYPLELEDADGCRRRLTVTIDPPARHFLNAGADAVLAFGDSLALSPGLNFAPDTLFWSPAAGLSCADCLRPIARPSQTTTYRLTARTPQGCRLTSSITIAVETARFLYLPNAFSPNGDGVNDRFVVWGNGKSVREIRFLRVFDRWGGLLYEAGGFAPGDNSRGWDGQMRGRPAPAGAYVYLIEAVLADGNTRQWSGEVLLVR